MRIVSDLVEQLAGPREFFDNAREEGWEPAFVFFLRVTLSISVITPILNFFGMESTDFSSSPISRGPQAILLAFDTQNTSNPLDTRI